MIFCGDIALPFAGGIRILGMPEHLRRETWIGNLEGSLCSDNEIVKSLRQDIVFNNFTAIEDLCSFINFECFGIANNHLEDAAPVETTLDNLAKLQKEHIGAGVNISSAKRELILGEYVLIAFGWMGIGCKLASDDKAGVNSYDRWSVEGQIEQLIKKYPYKKIICFMHWNYELELYPQPLDRDLAHRLIECGAFGVIGCHAHRVQPIEIYRGRPIVYGLGNFAFIQNTFMKGELRFPEFSYKEIAFEITDKGEFRIHNFLYDPQAQTITYQEATKIENASFSTLSSSEYKSFFKAHRVQKKLLPSFFYEDCKIVYLWKLRMVGFRQFLINIFVRNKTAFSIIKKILSKLS